MKLFLMVERKADTINIDFVPDCAREVIAQVVRFGALPSRPECIPEWCALEVGADDLPDAFRGCPVHPADLGTRGGARGAQGSLSGPPTQWHPGHRGPARRQAPCLQEGHQGWCRVWQWGWDRPDGTAGLHQQHQHGQAAAQVCQRQHPRGGTTTTAAALAHPRP